MVDKAAGSVMIALGDSHFKPGMFADVGLGAEPRKVWLVPSAAVLHVGKADYVFAAGKEPGDWRAVPVVP